MTLRIRDDRVHWRQIDRDVVAVDVESSTYLSTNGSGAVLWLALAEGATREQLVERLAEAYLIDAERAAADVDAFLRDLREQDLLVEP